MLWNGNVASTQPGSISFLLDADLSSDIAKALSLFGFDIIHHNDVPQFQNRPEGVEDPEIIQWCKDNNRTWITHDFEAHRKHEEAIKLARIHVVWVRGKTEQTETGESATWRFFKMLVRGIDVIQRKLLSCDGAMHIRVSPRIGTHPVIDWTQLPSDRPRGTTNLT